MIDNDLLKITSCRTKAVFFDIDGTLVSFKTHAVPEDTKAAIAALRQKGIKVFVATGRMLPMMEEVLKGIEFDGYIAYNGACCVDATLENVIYKSPLPQKELEALVARLKVDRIPVSFMCRHEMYVNYINDTVLEVARIVDVPPPVVRDPEEIIKEDVYQICVYAGEEKLAELIREVLPDCESSRWIPIFADINKKGLNKSLGIDKMLEYHGIPLENTLAFGDGGNDLPMLKHVAVGVAMGNASEHVKAAADYVTTSVDEGGIVHALRYLGVIAES